MASTDFRAIADGLAAAIAAGRLKPGERLLPQREFAYRHGIAASTAGRVYAELHRRGLVSGEVGRGTYVRSTLGLPNPALAEPAPTPIDLALNFPLLAGQGAQLSRSLAAGLRADAFEHALRPVGPAGTAGAREAAAAFLGRGRWQPDPGGVLFAGNGRQAIAASLSALAPAGSRVGADALTYPLAISVARRLGIELVPIAMDDEGMRPDALAAVHRATPLKAVYLQPFLHNPLGVSMSQARRQDIAAFLRRQDLPAVEDAIYSFLVDDEPLADLAPDHVVVVDSLSKRIAPGLTLGFAVAPPARVEALATALRSGAWSCAAFPLAAGLQWMADGTAARLQAMKRLDAVARQEIARNALHGLSVRGDPRAYHLWLELPGPWRAEAYVAAAAALGISTVPAGAFAVSGGYAPDAIRLALASPPLEGLAKALSLLRTLALAGPGQEDVG